MPAPTPLRLLLFALALTIAAAACGDNGTTEPPPNPEANFPKGFLWGTAVAGFQVEAGCPTLPAATCEDRGSDWYVWVTDPDLVADTATAIHGDPLSAAPGFWETYAQDLDRAADELGTNAFRTSLEWSRLFPDAAAEGADSVEALDALADADAVAHYRAIFAAAREREQTLLVTINHYTLPTWLHDAKGCHADLDACTDRGWLDGPRILRAITLYAAWCAHTFGDQVDLWATVNEPFGMVLSAYIFPSPERTNPPGVMLRFDAARDALLNLIAAHAAMYDAVHAHDTVDADRDGVSAKVGVVKNLVAFAPADPDSADDQLAVTHAEWVMNRFFLEGAVRGALDTNLDGVIDETRPELADRMDYIGINYYTRMPIKAVGAPLGPDFPFTDFLPDLAGGTFVTYADGLYEVIAIAAAYGRPILITETGTPHPGDDAADTFLLPHLRAVHRAIADGYDVQGFFYWSLIDNYEWNHGLSLPFGLYALDPATKARTLRPVGARYAEIIRARGF